MANNNVDFERLVALIPTMKAFTQAVSRSHFRIFDISNYIETFRTSVILTAIMNNPNDKQALTCLTLFLNDHQEVSQFYNSFMLIAQGALSLVSKPASCGTSITLELDLSNITSLNGMPKTTVNKLKQIMTAENKERQRVPDTILPIDNTLTTAILDASVFSEAATHISLLKNIEEEGARRYGIRK